MYPIVYKFCVSLYISTILGIDFTVCYTLSGKNYPLFCVKM